ncbi:CHASE2 domain-containing protein [Candidatus Peregrinibacteria bacterium]|nr:CHASE2 domain-containing protein [Candidatus Peregrinibacteria bacterium]
MNYIIKNKIFGGILISLAITFICFITSIIGGDLIQNWNYKITDNLYTLEEVSEDIIIVAIDDYSVIPRPIGLGKVTSWSRENYTRVLEKLEEAGAKIIGFDLLLTNPTTSVNIEKFQAIKSIIDDSSENEKQRILNNFIEKYSNQSNIHEDIELAELFKKYGNIVVPMVVYTSGDGVKTPLLPFEKFREGAVLGAINLSPDDDGIYRKYPSSINIEPSEENYKSFALKIAEIYLDKELDLPTNNGEILINYFGDPFTFPMVSYLKVLNGSVDLNMFEDKIALIGITSFKEIQDKGLTPKSNTSNMPLVEIHANAIQTILSGKFLEEQSAFSWTLTIAGVSAVLAIAFNYLGIWLSVILFLLAFAGYWQAGHFFFKRGLILNMFYPFLAITLTYLASWIYQYFITNRHKREIKAAFGHYVSKELVEEISKNPDSIKLGGEKKVVTVFFSDIKGSTSISEQVEISSWVSQINEYFTVMEDIIQKYGGTVDKYEGDAIMGFWNAPLSSDKHTLYAYMAALEMQKALNDLKQKWQTQGNPAFDIRIGINTGEAIVGNFGSANRFDYTAMGDTVNTASRLESSANKTYDTSVIVAGFENHEKPESLNEIIMRELDTVYLPGKNEPVKLYELICLKSEYNDQIKVRIENYNQALTSYRNKDFETAIKFFQANPNDAPSKIMLQRCEKLKNGEQIKELDENMVYRILNK